MRFVDICARKLQITFMTRLSVQELQKTKIYWFSTVQQQRFAKEIVHLQKDHQLHKSSPLIPLDPFVDTSGLICVGGREQKSNRAYSTQHPVVVHGSHFVTHLKICSELLQLLHAGPTLLSCSLNRCFHIVGGHKTIRSVTYACVACHRAAAKPQVQGIEQLPAEHVKPDVTFDHVGMDYTGSLQPKIGLTRRPVIVKSCVRVCFSVCSGCALGACL